MRFTLAKKMSPVRLKDWNSSLGVVALTILTAWFSIYAFTHPDFLTETGEDRRILMRMLPYVGPLVALFYLYKQVWFLEIGDKIGFQRSFGKKTYDWQDLKGVSVEFLKKRVLFVPVTHEFLCFSLKGERGTEFHSYRVTKKSKAQVFGLIELHAPTIKIG
jgi:hypothetical protein